jgi:hypothetical protein
MIYTKFYVKNFDMLFYGSDLLDILELAGDLLGGAELRDSVDGGHDRLLDDLPLDESIQDLRLFLPGCRVLLPFPLHCTQQHGVTD